MKRTRTLALVSWLALFASPALPAHDFWIEPSTFTPAPGQRMAVRLRADDHFPGQAVPRNEKRIERFALLGKGAELAVRGADGHDPAGYAVAGEPGLYLLVYDSHRARLTLPAEKFERHLAEQGLERIRDLRGRKGWSAAPGREVYSRCAKALVAVGDGNGEGFDRRAGLPLELIPEENPFRLAPGEELPLRLLYQGQPLAGAWVQARNPRRVEETSAGRTDGEGRVRLRLASGGFWLIKAVHMVPAPQGSGADWESFWAALTFEARGR